MFSITKFFKLGGTVTTMLLFTDYILYFENMCNLEKVSSYYVTHSVTLCVIYLYLYYITIYMYILVYMYIYIYIVI